MSVVLKPIITEKSIKEAALGKFTFEVLKSADKKAIKKEIEEKFKVNVISISTIIVKGKTQRVGIRRREVTKSSYKKAIAKLKEGQKIDLFDIGGQK